jgi:hypothetical protein
MNIVGTPCSAVHRSAATAGENHRRTMGQAAQHAHHHAKAVIERHRNAQPVGRSQLHRFADEIAIVQDVVMRQRGTLGRTCCPGGELDVDRIIELQSLAAGLQRGALVGAGSKQQIIEVESALGFLCAQAHHHFELRQLRRPEISR